MKLPVTSFSELVGNNGFGGRLMVCTGNRGDGRFVVVVVVMVIGANTRGGLSKYKRKFCECFPYIFALIACSWFALIKMPHKKHQD